jgi:hypothetical protein
MPGRGAAAGHHRYPPAVRRLDRPIDAGHDAARGFHTLTFHMTLRPEFRDLWASLKRCRLAEWSHQRNLSS